MTIGLRDLFRAPITLDADGNEVYGKPVRMAKAIQAQLSITTAEAKLFADDGVDEQVKEFVSGQLTLGVNDLIPGEQAIVLGQKQDADGVLYASDADDPPYFAIGFRASKMRGRFKYLWFYKVKFAIPDENFQTKGDSIAFNTPSIVGTIVKRDKDGKWKADHVALASDPVAQKWFDEVREFVKPTDPPPDPGDPGDPIDP